MEHASATQKGGKQSMKAKTLSTIALLVVLSLLVTQCGPTPEPQTIIQTVEVEKKVVETVEVEKQVIETVEVEKTVIEEKIVEVTAVPAPKVPEGTLTMALSTFPNSIDRPQAAERQASNTSQQMWDSLLWVNEEGELEPALAESYEISDDGTEYTFHLRDDVVFHNGEPFNADSVVFTWERAANADYEYSYYFTNAESVEKIDDYTVKVTTPEPDALFLRLMADYWAMIPPGYYEEVGEEGFVEHPIGTGPFMFVEWVKGDHITMEANPNYWREGVPKVQNLVFRPIPESSTRVAAIQTGEVDVVGRLSSEEAQSLLGVPNVKVIRYPSTRIYYIAFNNLTTGEGQPTEDPLVRQAMNYAVDVDAIADALFDGFAQRATGYVAEGEMGYGVVEPFGYDPDKARELLAEAGYPDGFAMDFACPAGAYIFFEQVCEAVQGYLGDVGIETELEIMESGQYWDLEAEKQLPPLFGDSWSSTLGEAYNRLLGALGGWDASYSSWSDPKIDEMLEQISQAIDFEERKKLYEDLQVYMQEDPPFIYLYQLMTFEAISTRVQNYTPRGAEDYFLMNTWVITEE
jgi:peptide/nickel transport system substrate-binding protein